MADQNFISAARFGAGKPCANIDDLYGPYSASGGQTALQVAEAEILRVYEQKVKGLTVGIVQNDGSVKEYWYQPNQSNVLELVEKHSVDQNPTQNSQNPVSSGGVYTALEGYVPKSQTTGLLKNDGTIDTTTAGKADSALQPNDVKTINNQSIVGSGNITIEGGQSGANAYIHIKYSANIPTQDSDMHATPQNGDKYIGVYSGTSSTAPTSYTSYTWSKYVGENGANGQSIKYINADDAEELPTASSSYSNVVALVPSTTQQGVADQYACIENAIVEGQTISGWSWVLIGTTAPIVSVQRVDTYQPMLQVKTVDSYVGKATGGFTSSSTLETVIYDISDAKKLVCDFTVINAGTLSLSFFDDGLDLNDLSTASSHYLGWRVDKSKPPYVVTENTRFENQVINIDSDETLGSGDITNARYVGLTRLIASHFGGVSVLTPVPQSLVKKQPIALNEILIFNTLIQLPQIWNSDTADSAEITTQQTLSTWGVVFPSTYTNIGKPTPIIAMLHGLSGYVANGVLGYSTAGWIASRQAYLDAGFAVMDINGYGTGDSDDQDSRPWGNPASVETLDKAFEYLKQNYNICDKLLIAGISMGGILAMSYAKCFPGKVSAVGLFAPNLLAYTIRYLPSTDQQVPNSKEIAWGYVDHSEAAADNYNHLTGYVLLNKCNCVDNGIVKPYAWPSEKPSTWPDNLTDLELIEYFPVAMRVWQGTSDTSVNPNCSKLLVKSLRNGNSDATLRLCQGANHDVQNVQYVRNEAVSWFKRFTV